MKTLKHHCELSTSLPGYETYCSKVVFGGDEYEEIPAKAILQTALGVEEKQKNLKEFRLPLWLQYRLLLSTEKFIINPFHFLQLYK